MPTEDRSIEKPSLEDLNDDIVEAVWSQGQWKQCGRAEQGEDGTKDLELLRFGFLMGWNADFIG